MALIADWIKVLRWDWIKAEFKTNPVIFFMTYDEMYDQLAQYIASWKDDLASAKVSA